MKTFILCEVVSKTLVPPSGVGQCYPSGSGSTREGLSCVCASLALVIYKPVTASYSAHSLFTVERAERGSSSEFPYSQFQLFGFTVIFVIVIRGYLVSFVELVCCGVVRPAVTGSSSRVVGVYPISFLPSLVACTTPFWTHAKVNAGISR